MGDQPTYYFVLPDIDRPVGGVNVLLQFIDMLNRAGYRAAPLYGSPAYRYNFAHCEAQGYYLDDLKTLARRSLGRRAKLATLSADLVSPRQTRANIALQRKPSDVYVIPEYGYPELAGLFTGHKCILAVQDVFGLMRAGRRDMKRPRPVLGDFAAVFATSAASHQAVTALTGTGCHRLTLNIERAGLSYQADKKPQIAYMPRKRAEDADIVVGMLQARASMAGISFVEIDNMSGQDLVRVLGDSLMFLSFSYQEGFGLPPAEAMAAGCLVVGYSGVGGEEYFSRDVAFPIPDSDVVAFIDTVEVVMGEYRMDPTRLDRMRQTASEQILARYNGARAQETLLRVWKEIHRDLIG